MEHWRNRDENDDFVKLKKHGRHLSGEIQIKTIDYTEYAREHDDKWDLQVCPNVLKVIIDKPPND